MNWANRITCVRLILLPVILILLMIYPFGILFDGWMQVISVVNSNITYQLPVSYLIAGILFIIASLSDMLDGYIARHYNQVTNFGKFFDSIADKLLTNGVLIVFACAGIIPVWMCCILVLRDFLIDVVRQILATKTVVMGANQLGRYRAAVEMLGMTILFFIGFQMFGGIIRGTGKFDEYGWVNQIIMIPMYIATLLSIISAGNYIYLNRKAIFQTEVIPSIKTPPSVVSKKDK